MINAGYVSELPSREQIQELLNGKYLKPGRFGELKYRRIAFQVVVSCDDCMRTTRHSHSEKDVVLGIPAQRLTTPDLNDL